MKKIGVVTSGGDAPGMNAAIRAAVRIARSRGIEVIGYRRGWDGLVNNRFNVLSLRSVGNIIQTGGTILHTCRCPGFKEIEQVREAAANLADNDVEGLIVIGGDGSFRAAHALSKETDALIVGVPATIDNDVYGTDETIGFDTAVNTCISEIDKIRDTATALDRIFIVEVMGRTRGFIASMVGLASGAEVILIPELPVDRESIYQSMHANHARGKTSGIIVAAEGIGDTRQLALDIEANTGLETRLSIIGYAQRGGSPSARSRYLAGLFSEKAVQLLVDHRGSRVVGIRNGSIGDIDLDESCHTKKPIDQTMLALARDLAR
jgi:6-phosphofructokinase 1